VADPPPATDVGESVTSMSGGVALGGGLTVSARFAALAPYDADSETAVDAATDLFVTNANDALVEPAKIVRFGGSDEKSSG
jgi:hypothetical protein